MDLIDTLLTKASWGRNELKTLHPVYGPMLHSYSIDVDKTTLNVKSVIEALYRFVCLNKNYSYPTEFEDEIKSLNKSMIGKTQLLNFTSSFLTVNFGDHPTLTKVIEMFNTTLKSNNSYKVVILEFKKSFIKCNI